MSPLAARSADLADLVAKVTPAVVSVERLVNGAGALTVGFADTDPLDDLVRTDASINPGNSGDLLVSANEEPVRSVGDLVRTLTLKRGIVRLGVRRGDRVEVVGVG